MTSSTKMTLNFPNRFRKLTQNKKQFTRINWSILFREIPIKAGANTCNLWLKEKLKILRSCNSKSSLNVANFLRNTCMRTDFTRNDSKVLVVSSRRKAFAHRRPKTSSSRCLYYPNSCASRQLLQGGDISVNPGPGQSSKTKKVTSSTPSPECNKRVQTNYKHFICTKCFDLYHEKCTKYMQTCFPHEWICTQCLQAELPFYCCDEQDYLVNHIGQCQCICNGK